MPTFNVINKMPGVYIQEIDLPGPIAGVSTSIAAFIGPALTGPILQPTRVTNFTQFANTFGLPDADGNLVPFFPQGGIYAPHAVRGFFDNGGATCYFVRVSRARRASLTLVDRAGTPQPTLVVRARTEGVAGNNITVTVQDANAATGRNVVKATAPLVSASGTQAVLTSQPNANLFRPGDVVLLSEGGNTDRATIASVSSTSPTITFGAPLANTYTAAGTIRIADLIPGQRTFRLDNAANVEVGSTLELTDGTNTEAGVVQAVNTLTGGVTLTTGLANTFGMDAADPAVTAQTLEFTLVIAGGPGGSRTVPNLSMDPRHSRYVISTLAGAGADADILLPPTPSPTPPPDNRPAAGGPTNLANGSDENVAGIGPADYANGLDALREVDEVSLVAIPDRTDGTVQGSMIAHCQDMADRFAILDPPPNLGVAEIQAHRATLASDRGFAALYYPRIVVPNPLAGASGQTATILVPPSGHIAGLYARTDEDKGVHKAPANELAPVRRRRRAHAQRDRSRPAERDQRQRDPVLPREGASRLGRAHDRAARSHAVALRQRSPAAPLHRGVDPGGHRVRGVRAEQRGAVGDGEAAGQRIPDAGVALGRARRDQARGSVPREGGRRAEPAGDARAGAVDHRGPRGADDAGRVHRVPNHPAAGQEDHRRIAVEEERPPWQQAIA